jgi:hypothetical protein
MTNRDRLVLIGVVSLAVLAAAWLLVVSPERKKAASLKAEVSSASAQLATAEGKVASARADQARYATAYAAIVRLGKAVPAGQELPSLMYQLAQASDRKDVDFASITTGTSTAGGSSSSASAAVTPVSSAGFTQMPFTFVFNGTFDDLYRLFQQLNGYTMRTTAGGVRVSGRLLTIQSTKLAPEASSAGASAKGSSGRLTGTISATAYVLPAGQGLTGGATPTSPTGGSATTVSGGASTAPAAPAIARVTP